VGKAFLFIPAAPAIRNSVGVEYLIDKRATTFKCTQDRGGHVETRPRDLVRQRSAWRWTRTQLVGISLAVWAVLATPAEAKVTSLHCGYEKGFDIVIDTDGGKFYMNGEVGGQFVALPLTHDGSYYYGHWNERYDEGIFDQFTRAWRVNRVTLEADRWMWFHGAIRGEDDGHWTGNTFKCRIVPGVPGPIF
jgi:hypothetical protein